MELFDHRTHVRTPVAPQTHTPTLWETMAMARNADQQQPSGSFLIFRIPTVVDDAQDDATDHSSSSSSDYTGSKRRRANISDPQSNTHESSVSGPDTTATTSMTTTRPKKRWYAVQKVRHAVM